MTSLDVCVERDSAEETPKSVQDPMIGVLIIAHGSLGERLVDAVTHVLGARPAQFEVFAVSASDDPLLLPPRAREATKGDATAEGSLVFSDIFVASPSNLAVKLLDPGHVEVIAG